MRLYTRGLAAEERAEV
jgi:hypothetical protein